MNQAFATAEISKAVNIAALAKFCHEQGLQLVSSDRGLLVIRPVHGREQEPRERQKVS
jgi:hypothetical protein